jgi:hypothetical protein
VSAAASSDQHHRARRLLRNAECAPGARRPAASVAAPRLLPLLRRVRRGAPQGSAAAPQPQNLRRRRHSDAATRRSACEMGPARGGCRCENTTRACGHRRRSMLPGRCTSRRQSHAIDDRHAAAEPRMEILGPRRATARAVQMAAAVSVCALAPRRRPRSAPTACRGDVTPHAGALRCLQPLFYRAMVSVTAAAAPALGPSGCAVRRRGHRMSGARASRAPCRPIRSPPRGGDPLRLMWQRRPRRSACNGAGSGSVRALVVQLSMAGRCRVSSRHGGRPHATGDSPGGRGGDRYRAKQCHGPCDALAPLRRAPPACRRGTRSPPQRGHRGGPRGSAILKFLSGAPCHHRHRHRAATSSPRAAPSHDAAVQSMMSRCHPHRRRRPVGCPQGRRGDGERHDRSPSRNETAPPRLLRGIPRTQCQQSSRTGPPPMCAAAAQRAAGLTRLLRRARMRGAARRPRRRAIAQTANPGPAHARRV